MLLHVFTTAVLKFFISTHGNQILSFHAAHNVFELTHLEGKSLYFISQNI